MRRNSNLVLMNFMIKDKLKFYIHSAAGMLKYIWKIEIVYYFLSYFDATKEGA